MRGVSRFMVRLLVVAALLPVPLARAQWSHDANMPVQVATSAAFTQQAGAAVPDGAGGAFVFFLDDRLGSSHVYAQHMRADGRIDPTWPVGGRAVCEAFFNQSAIKAVTDGAGGAYVCWNDLRTGTQRNYVTRMLADGTLSPAFPVGGLTVSAMSNAQYPAQICADGVGGVLVVWEHEYAPTDHDVFSAEVMPNGTIPLETAVSNTSLPEVTPSVCLESPTHFAIVFRTVGGTIKLKQQLVQGGMVLGEATLTSVAHVDTPPQICPDGWGGEYVLFSSESPGPTYVPSYVRCRNGGAFSSVTPLATAGSATVSFGNLEYAGNQQAWFAWSVGPGMVLRQVRITRDGPSAPDTLGVLAFSLPGPLLTSDGEGGVITAYSDGALGGQSAYVSRRDVNLLEPGLWAAASAEGLCAARGVVDIAPDVVCSDGDGGAFVFTHDVADVPSRLRVVRTDRNGAYDAAPGIVSVKDVANDQGGHVRVAFHGSYLDRASLPQVDSYRLWRQVPVAAAQASLKRGVAAYSASALEEPAPGAIRIDASTNSAYAWEFVTSQVASAFANYSLTVPTVADSADGGPANTIYMVEARASALGVGWPSMPDSGHSVDNLAPASPVAFVGALLPASESTQLRWTANTESDLAGYELYRGATAGFVPKPGTLVATVTRTDYIDTSMGQYYKLAAIDAHGNRSAFAVVTPGATLDALGDPAPRVLALALESANPAVSGALLRYELPVAGSVSLRLYDVHGRVVRELLAGAVAAGRHTLRWDGRDASGGEAASGMYFARLTLGGETRVQRLVLAH